MGFGIKIKQTATEFRQGMDILFHPPKSGEGDRKLAKLSNIVMAQIPVYGKHAVYAQMVKAIQGDMKKYAKKGRAEIDAKIANAVATPEYMELLRRVDMDKAHLIVLGNEAMKKYGKAVAK